MTSKARDISISGVGIGIHSGGAGMASTVTTLNFIGDGNAMAFRAGYWRSCL
jgi:succinate dehydrogenase/fumarate reductase flavoprotein subunit